jgi:hypothetical protein
MIFEKVDVNFITKVVYHISAIYFEYFKVLSICFISPHHHPYDAMKNFILDKWMQTDHSK